MPYVRCQSYMKKITLKLRFYNEKRAGIVYNTKLFSTEYYYPYNT